MVKVPIGLFSRGNRKTNWWLELVVLQLENWRRDIGQILLRCIQYGNGFSISHLRVVTCDRRLKCSRYISRWDLQGTRPDLPSFLSNDRGKMHVRRRLLLVRDITGKQKRLSLYIYIRNYTCYFNYQIKIYISDFTMHSIRIIYIIYNCSTVCIPINELSNQIMR